MDKMPSSPGLQRRQFLRAGAAAALPLILPSRLFGAASPSRTLNVAIAGAGTRSRAHTHGFSAIPGVRVVAVCDVWPKRTAAAKKNIDRRNGDTACKTYQDYREMVADPAVDIVSIAAPDHWHALIAIEAANRGKHIYLEKPFAYSVREGRAIIDAAKRNGVMIQYGTQQRSNSNFQRATMLAKRGYLGEVDCVYAIAPPGPVDGDPAPIAPPAGFDYDFFTGPAPTTPYVEGLAQRKGTPGWYFLSPFSGGWITAWGSHHVDSAQWALGKDGEAPVKIEARGSRPPGGAWDTVWEWYSEITYADGKKLIYMSSNRPEMPAVKGNIVVAGSKGWAAATRGRFSSKPPHLARISLPVDDPEFQHIRRGGDAMHYVNFIDAIRYGTRQNTTMEIGQQSTNLCHLTNIAIEAQRPLQWDGDKEAIPNDPVANRMLGRPMRAPWKLPA